MKTLPSLQKVRAERCRRSFAAFFRQGWHVLEPSLPLSDNWHIDALCDHIQALLEDWRAVQRSLQSGRESPAQRVQNLVVNIPPGTAKSRIFSVYAPAWMWLEWPAWRTAQISGNPRVALRDSIYCRELIRSAWYQELFQPNWGTTWALTKDQDAKSLFRNTSGGLRLAIGAKAKITGDRFDHIGVDDPNEMATIYSDAERDGVNDWWDQGAGNRLNDLRYSTRSLIMQRGHEDDMSGHVLPGGAWAHLFVPMEFAPERACKCPSCRRYAENGVDEIGWSDPRATEGELLDAVRFPPRILAEERTRLGEVMYAGQMNQDPAPAEGTIFKTDSWSYYKEIPRDFDELGCSWDMTFKDTDGSDYVVGQAWGRKGANRYLLDLVRERMNFDQTCAAVIAMGNRWPTATLKLVEDKANGPAVISHLSSVVPGLVAVDPKILGGSKVARAYAIQPLQLAGNLYLPDPAVFDVPWLPGFIAEHQRFPRVAHDDQVDACTQMNIWWIHNAGAWLESY